MCGYRHPFATNMITIYVILLMLALTVLAFHFYDRRTGKNFMPSACNFTLRFVYEFTFEAFLSVLILSATLGAGQDNAGAFTWLLAIGVFFGIGILIFFLISRFSQGGPYSPSRYSDSSSPLNGMMQKSYDGLQVDEVTERNAGVVLDFDQGCPIRTEEEELLDASHSSTPVDRVTDQLQ